ncbi:MAG: glycosyltransferase [Alphaproteobacteria bacterium]|nr:glycosyltransferase [Alphaproteobacteria bacterium]
MMRGLINIACCMIPMPSLRRPLRRNLQRRWYAHTNNPDIIINRLTGKPVIVWFDHALGGGTEVYSKRQIKALRQKFDIIRVQYFPATELYHMTWATNRHRVFKTPNVYQVYNLCCDLHADEIVVNNLVAYKSTTDMLGLIRAIKQNNPYCPRVSFRGHDFHCICPSFNLINCDGEYCGLQYGGGCEQCWGKKRLGDNKISDRVLKSGAISICSWRHTWQNFLENTADSVIVFSEKIANIFTTAYPNIKNKISVIPHTVRKFKVARIRPHNDINIAVLGAISQQKGADIIRDMACHLTDNVKIKIIGTMKNAPENVYVYGKYKPKQLPRIMEREQIDLVFIPSVWPETFSYTTSEAISMGLPVACFDIGAPAERVSKYNRGLVLNTISPKQNLTDIINFIKKQRQTL